MHFQFSNEAPAAPNVSSASSEGLALLGQLVDLQREQINLLRASAAVHDQSQRWRSVLARYPNDFPLLPENCREALPILERAYISLIAELADNLKENGAFDSDFVLGEFLDRYGMRLSQLGVILSLVGPLADAASSPEESS